MPSNVKAAVERIKLATAKRLLAAVVTLQSATKIDHNQSHPPASTPGQYPHGRTWNLREGTVYAPTSPTDVAKTLVVKVGLTQQAWYGLVLWTKGRRLGMVDTLNRIRSQLRAIITGGRS